MGWPLKYMGEMLPDYDEDKLEPGQVYSFDREKFKGKGEHEGYYMWPAQLAKHTSAYYQQNNAHRLPLVLVIPTGGLFFIDGMCYSNDEYERQKAAGVENPQGYYGGWTVTGDIEQGTLTVSPSINIGSTYHGWVTNNVMTDDCEGRTYSPDGKILTGPNAHKQ